MRELPEWIGKTDDDRLPDRIRVRVFMRHGGRCHCCHRFIRTGEAWDCDHIIALANGGQHRESNLAPILSEHHRKKTKSDVAEKSATYQSRKRHLGLKRPKHPMPGSRASKWKRKMDGTIVKR